MKAPPKLRGRAVVGVPDPCQNERRTAVTSSHLRALRTTSASSSNATKTRSMPPTGPKILRRRTSRTLSALSVGSQGRTSRFLGE
jgi:hypothetical protein